MKTHWHVDLLKHDAFRGWLVEKSEDFISQEQAWKFYRTHEPPPFLVMQLWEYRPGGRTPAYAHCYGARWEMLAEKQGAEEFC